MTPKALRALKGSIRKWRLIVLGEGVDKGSANCPLCKAFPGSKCQGCPVAKAVGISSCLGTPYQPYRAAMRNNQFRFALVAARAEYDFLKSLLPKRRR